MSKASSRAFDRRSLAILISAVLWGCYWIPLRQIDSGTQGSALMLVLAIVLPSLVLLPRLLVNPGRVRSWGPVVWLTGLAFGCACSLYAEGALRGNVARVILLFYLTPVWSTLLARIFLAEPITSRRLVTLGLGLTGMYVILGVDSGLPLPQTMSEWFGLLAGMAWAVALVGIQKTRDIPMLDLLGAVFLFYALVFILLSLIPGGRHWEFDASFLQPINILWVLALAFLWNLPAAVLTLYGATEVEPGQAAILLMVEVVVGIGTAAWLTSEPFGSRELIGASLIIASGIVEFVSLPARATNQVN